MDTKLTLKLDQEIIEKAKLYAANKKISLSRIIEAYLQFITNDADSNEMEFEISPYVKSITAGNKIPKDYNYKDDYTDHISKKYK